MNTHDEGTEPVRPADDARTVPLDPVENDENVETTTVASGPAKPAGPAAAPASGADPAAGRAAPIDPSGPADQPEPTDAADQPAPTDPAAPTAAARDEQTARGGCVPAARTHRTGPRTGPIVWGALILAFCGYTAQRAFGAGELDTAWWITATVIGLGALLLIVGTAVLLRSRRHEDAPRADAGSRPRRTG